jgi:hypothetical protein
MNDEGKDQDGVVFGIATRSHSHVENARHSIGQIEKQTRRKRKLELEEERRMAKLEVLESEITHECSSSRTQTPEPSDAFDDNQDNNEDNDVALQNEEQGRVDQAFENGGLPILSWSLCPVCNAILQGVPSDTDLDRPIHSNSKIYTIMQNHCKRHEREPIWNIQPKMDLRDPMARKEGAKSKRGKSAVVCVPSMIKYALKNAARKIPLPGDAAFSGSWCEVRNFVCCRIGQAIGIIYFHMTNYYVNRDRCVVPTSMVASMQDYKDLDLKEGKGVCRNQKLFLKAQAAAYLNDLLQAVMLAGPPEARFAFSPGILEDTPWMELTNRRRRNAIELFFWTGKDHNHRTCGLLSPAALPVSAYF